jgi:hypothetical protein
MPYRPDYHFANAVTTSIVGGIMRAAKHAILVVPTLFPLLRNSALRSAATLPGVDSSLVLWRSAQAYFFKIGTTFRFKVTSGVKFNQSPHCGGLRTTTDDLI